MGFVARSNVMDGDPERLSGMAGHELERALLESLHTVTVPSDAKGMVWGALSAQVVTTAAGAGVASAVWRFALKGAAASKAALLVPVVAAGLAVAVLHHGSAPVPSNAAAASSATPIAAALGPADPAPPLPEAPTPERDAPLRPSLAPAKDRLARESAALTRARAELRAGNAAAARATLSRMQQKFGAGGLYQEREVLGIEALAAQGNAAEADRLARNFIAAHPESPHKAALQRFVR